MVHCLGVEPIFHNEVNFYLETLISSDAIFFYI